MQILVVDAGAIGGFYGLRLAEADHPGPLGEWAMLAVGEAITCPLRGTIGDVLATAEGAAVAVRIVAKVRAIAAGHGHAPRPAAVAQADETLSDPQSRWAASMMRDIQQGARRLEAEHVIGDLIRRGRQLGLPAPMLEASFAQLQVYNALRAA